MCVCVCICVCVVLACSRGLSLDVCVCVYMCVCVGLLEGAVFRCMCVCVYVCVCGTASYIITCEGCNGDTRSTPAWHMHHGRLWKQFAPGINPHMVRCVLNPHMCAHVSLHIYDLNHYPNITRRALCMSMLDDNKELERPILCPPPFTHT